MDSLQSLDLSAAPLTWESQALFEALSGKDFPHAVRIQVRSNTQVVIKPYLQWKQASDCLILLIHARYENLGRKAFQIW